MNSFSLQQASDSLLASVSSEISEYRVSIEKAYVYICMLNGKSEKVSFGTVTNSNLPYI